jgi:hypothetical protein
VRGAVRAGEGVGGRVVVGLGLVVWCWPWFRSSGPFLVSSVPIGSELRGAVLARSRSALQGG